ncbi:MAG: phosphate signaling complex protein PhoU [Gemmataceae bacterium]|nr:phosphate signaling complex protein PhoU [Gemmataceae bacterium]
MSKHLQRDLDQLQRDILDMGTAVEEAVSRAVRAVLDHDVALAQHVIDGDTPIDLQENQVEEECLKILALHQPVATDLRRITAVLLINTDLERMADLAVEVAERAVHLAKPPHLPIPTNLRAMSDMATAMVRQSLDAFVHLDAKLARRVVRLDDEVDRHNEEIIEELIGLMKQKTDYISPGLSMFSVVRHLERIADHATNIAEDVVYLVEGEIVRHRPESRG